MVPGGHPVVVVDLEVPLHLGVLDTGVHAVEPHQLVAELGHVHGGDGFAGGRVVGGLGVEQDDADVGAAAEGESASHLVGDEPAVGQAGQHDRPRTQRLQEP